MKRVLDLVLCRSVFRPCGTGLLLLLVATSWPATADEPAAKQPGAAPAAGQEEDQQAAQAKQIFGRMVAAYRAAKSYRDSGKMVLVAKTIDGEQKREEFPMQVEFVRPDRLRLEFAPIRSAMLVDPPSARVLLLADGKNIFARPEGFDGQVLKIADPPAVGRALYDDPRLARVLPDGITEIPLGPISACPQLELLLAEELPADFGDDEGKLLEPGTIDNRPCERIAFGDEGSGSLIFWIDRQTSLVRRLEYPVQALAERLSVLSISELSWTAEFAGAQLDPKLDDSRFAWAVDPKQRLVGQLIEPPNPREAPPKALGQPAPHFKFREGDQEETRSDGLAGKVTVIAVWAYECDSCPDDLPSFDAVRKKLADNGKVRFLSLNIDDAETESEALDELHRAFEVDGPYCRLTSHIDEFRKTFGVGEVPVLILLDAKGQVQSVESGIGPEAYEQLPNRIEAVVSGEDLAAKQQEAWKRRQQEYEEQINDAKAN